VLRAAIDDRSIDDPVKSLTSPHRPSAQRAARLSTDNSSGTFGTRLVRLTACEVIFAGRQLDSDSTQSMMLSSAPDLANRTCAASPV